ncbi:short-chain dehydrogenase [Paractinoplanes abujensis]|uniref:NAD(P)-dependent dehydrogenase (Short-subunit alcohol dehydrogenase family) n=1 Tax=Paractinoplanes abujensis TaxID=882441 RepID=A0A7W7CUR2_9ACTN|nr:SDR family oxidoreductase [Actinoplanes abujensis]MBB4695037.1 NAD(P)-dependent dehydrogenase (short-subunit alcohol dehydrogenase family) [Actinoplanes abujensis]GID23769.1 short-chain dehydrogenase [Actinoplanes abujensis]
MTSFVVTGGGRGVGRAIVERLLEEGGRVVVVEFDERALDWAAGRESVVPVIGDASDETVVARAVEAAGELRGWVNNAATFPGGWLHEMPAPEAAALIARNVDPVLAGCAAAVRAFLAAGVPGSIVNVSSHQAQRAVRGAFAYATAKAAIEGLTRALAVDYGRHSVRVNALALGSIATERSDAHLAGLAPGARDGFDREIRLLQPLGRMGRTSEVAEAAAFLLSDRSSFVNGAIIPVDGGRSAVGRDPEEI